MRSGASARPSRCPGRSKRPGEPRGGRGRAAHPGAPRAPRRRGVGGGGARRLRADPRRGRGSGARAAARAVLHALHALRLGRRGRRAALPAAGLLLRANPPAWPEASSSRSCSRTWGRARPGWPPSARVRRSRWWARSGSAGGPPAPSTRPVLVGGGIGTAPLLCLEDELRGARAGAARFSLGGPCRGGAGSSPGRWASPPMTAPRAGPDWSPTCSGSTSTANRRPPCSPAARRRCSRRCGPCAPSAAWPPSWRSSRAWPAASARVTAASCPRGTGTCACAWTGPVLDAERLESALFPGAGH